MASPVETCATPVSPTFEEEKDFQIDYWDGTALTPRAGGTFSEWYNRFVGNFEAVRHQRVCYNGMMATTRENLLHHPLQYYRELANEVNVSSSPEAVHFMERAMGPIFAPFMAYRQKG